MDKPLGGLMQELIDRSKNNPLAAESGPPEPPACPRCNGARYVRHKALAQADPKLGEVVPCPDCQRKSALTVEQRMERFGFSAIKTFADWKNHPTTRDAFIAAQDFAKSPHWVLTLRGECGTGKTHLAVAAAHMMVMDGSTAVFWNVPDLLDAIRACYARGADTEQYAFLESRIYNRDLVVLDDLGANKATEWSQAMLYEIVDKLYRMRATKKLIVTTNIDPNDALQIEPRLMSRIAPGDVIIKGARDRRAEFDR